MTDGWVALDDVSLTGATVTKYYYLGGQRVAMRQGGVLTYLHGDHGHAQHGWLGKPGYQRQRRESERAAPHRYREHRLAFIPVHREETGDGFSARASQKRGTG